MKTKRKEKGKKRKEKKRSEEKNVLPKFELRPFGEPGESSTTRPCGTHMHSFSWNFYYQNLRALLDMNSKIFFRRTRRL